MTGFNDFAPGHKECGQFIVRNISPQKKTIFIFTYPINLGCTRDLLKIPGVSEGDIKSSLMKGQLRHKFLVGDIELVYSDIDLLQFNDCGINYLEGLGFTTGVQIPPTPAILPYLWVEEVLLIGQKNNSNRTFNTPDKFLNGLYEGNEFHIHVKHDGRDLYEGYDYTLSESGGPGTGFDTVYITAFAPKPRSVLVATYAIQN